MNWKDYEIEIYNFFKEQYPQAEVSHNVTVEGRYSKTMRQIDILIEAYIAGNRMRIIIDGKYFSERIDVKDVEMFIAMVHDCNASKGILITHEGFSKAALNRAHNDPHDIELDILNFKNLYDYQGFAGMPFSGGNGVLMPAPFGWVIDSTRYKECLACLYQRGLTLLEAQKNFEFMYVNIRTFDSKIQSLDDLLKEQNELLLSDNSNAKIYYRDTIKRDDAKVIIRVLENPTYPTKEFTGIVAFEDFALICVLFSPNEVSNRNIRKLEYLMQFALPIDCIVNLFKWEVESTFKGPLLSVDIPYLVHDKDDLEYLTVVVPIIPATARPAFISIIIPNQINPSQGVSVSFSKTIDNQCLGKFVDLENSLLTIPFEEIDDEVCTARIKEGKILDVTQDEVIDIYQKMKEFNHMFFSFENAIGEIQTVSMPLFSFRDTLEQLTF